MTPAEVRALEAAVLAGRSLASLSGVPERTLETARALARWVAASEPALALALWQGCAALDDGCESWLGAAESALAVGSADDAWDAAARVLAHPSASPYEHARAHLVLARVCLLLKRADEAARWLARIDGDARDDVRRLAEALSVEVTRGIV
jgi:hypothetical protein